MFAGRRLLVATKHGKERVMRPLLEQGLQVSCKVPDDFDTDQFGTFTGEIERKIEAWEAARQKCLLAMQTHKQDLAVASEGSFGAHPAFLFGFADEEIVLLVDKANDVEIGVAEVSPFTNFGGALVRSPAELLAFAGEHLFPSHGLILRAEQGDPTSIVKGIVEHAALIREFWRFAGKRGSAYVETDMRAMFNPTRMDFIAKVTVRLVEKVKSLCPRCSCPGFGAVAAIPGLPCERCGFPTRSIKSYTYQCQRCGYNEVREVGAREAPGFCDFCNP